MDQRQIPTLRTIRETARMLNFPEYSLRQMRARGTLPGFSSGTRYYVNVDKLLELMNGTEKKSEG